MAAVYVPVETSNLPAGVAKELSNFAKRPEDRQHEHEDRWKDAADKHQSDACAKRPLHLLLERLGYLRVDLVNIVCKTIQNPTCRCRVEEADRKSEYLCNRHQIDLSVRLYERHRTDGTSLHCCYMI